MLGEIRRDTWHVFGRPGKDVPNLTEEIDELAFLFVVKACPYDSVPLRMLWVQRYLLCLLGLLERTLSFTFFGVRGQGRLLASQGHNLIQHLLLFGDHEGLG